MSVRVWLSSLIVVALSGCASRPPAPPAFAPVAAVAPPAPRFETAGVVAPPLLADGSYATPNRSVSPAAALWHLRAGLNVAALGCRGFADAALAPAYNALLAGHRAELAAAQRAVTAELGGAARYDDAMTRLYNYFAMPPAQPRFCAEAAAILAASADVPAGELSAFAQDALPTLDAPFIQVFAAVDASRDLRFASTAGTAAVASVVAPRVRLDASVLDNR